MAVGSRPDKGLQVEMPLEQRPPSTAELRAAGSRAWRGSDDGEALPSPPFLEVFTAAVARVGIKECVHLFDVQPTMLPDALRERDRKGPRLEWLITLLIAAPDAVKHELVTAINRIAGFRPPERRRELTADEELRVRRRATRRLAPAIADLIDQEVENA